MGFGGRQHGRVVTSGQDLLAQRSCTPQAPLSFWPKGQTAWGPRPGSPTVTADPTPDAEGGQVPYRSLSQGPPCPLLSPLLPPSSIQSQSTLSLCSPYPREPPVKAPPPHPPRRGLPDTPLTEQAPRSPSHWPRLCCYCCCYKACQILVPQRGTASLTLHSMHRVLTTGLPGNSHCCCS